MNELLKRIEALGSDGPLDELAGWLAHDDWQVRRAASDAFVARADSSSDHDLQYVVRYLFNGVASEDNAGLRSASLEALSRFAPRITSHLLAEIESGVDDVRVMLAPVVGETGREEAVLALTALARGTDANIATAAVIGLGRTNRRDAVRPLIEILDGEDAWVVFPAIESLGVLGDPEAVEPLARHLDDELLHATVLDALVRIGDPRAARAIAKRLFDGGPLRADLVEALTRIASEHSTPSLSVAARDTVIAAFREANDPGRFDELVELAHAGTSRSESALEALGWTTDARALPVLLVALGRPRTQASAAAGLAVLLDDPGIVAQVQRYQDRLSNPVREELVRALASTAPVEAVDLLVGLLTSGDADTVREAAGLAGEIADRFRPDSVTDAPRTLLVVERLVTAIREAMPEAAIPLARLASRLSSAGRVDCRSVLDGGNALLSSASLAARLAGAELVTSACGASEASRAVLARALDDRDPFVRQRAVEIIAAWDATASRPALEKSLSDEEPLVRRAAVAALARFSDETSTALLRQATGDWHGLVAADAIVALADRADGIPVGSLVAASRSDRALIRCIAIECLARLLDAPARARVREAAQSDPDFEVRRAAVASLHGRPDARAVLAFALDDPHHAVRHAAARLAGDLGDASLAPRLADLVDDDPSEAVSGEALVALAVVWPEEALERVGAAMQVPALAPYAVRVFEVLASRHADLLRKYHDADAPPRAAAAIDALGLLESR